MLKEMKKDREKKKSNKQIEKENSQVIAVARIALTEPEWLSEHTDNIELMHDKMTLPEEEYIKKWLPYAMGELSNDPRCTMSFGITAKNAALMTRKGKEYEKFMANLTPEEKEAFNRDLDSDGKMTEFKKCRRAAVGNALITATSVDKMGAKISERKKKRIEKRAQKMKETFDKIDKEELSEDEISDDVLRGE